EVHRSADLRVHSRAAEFLGIDNLTNGRFHQRRPRKILMTQGSGLYLAGPSLVKAAIGQIVDAEELGGAKMHSEISGTVDFFEKDDLSCLKRVRSLVALLPEARANGALGEHALPKTPKPAKNPDSVYDLISFEGQ